MASEKPRLASARKKRSILSVPLSSEQRSELITRAGRVPVSVYARDVLFPANDNQPNSRRTRGSGSVNDPAVLASVLAKLGQSEIASNLAELARLARLGSLPVTPETEAALRRASDDITAMKSLLMKALRIRED